MTDHQRSEAVDVRGPSDEMQLFVDRLGVQFAVSRLVPRNEAWVCRAFSHRTERLVDGAGIRITVVVDYEPEIVNLASPSSLPREGANG
jgi:hypothetical protein